MKLSPKNIVTGCFLPLLFMLIGINAFCGITTSNDTTKLKLGQHLRKEGFAPIFSVGTGITYMMGYRTFGISGRAYIPMPLGFRIVTNYINFIQNTDWLKESHLSVSLQYPIFSHGRINFYASVGANCIESKILKDITAAFSKTTIEKGTHYYFNPVFGLGTEIRINKLISIYNEWNMVNEDDLNTSLGMRVNFITLKKRRS